MDHIVEKMDKIWKSTLQEMYKWPQTYEELIDTISHWGKYQLKHRVKLLYTYRTEKIEKTYNTKCWKDIEQLEFP